MDEKLTAEDRLVLVFIQWYGEEREGRGRQTPQVEGMPTPLTLVECIHFPEMSHDALF